VITDRTCTEPQVAWGTSSSLRLDDSSLKSRKSQSAGSDTRDVIFQMQTMSPPGENNGGEDAMNIISMEEVGRHHLAQDAWVVVDGKVYE
jgi:hypothetical protein